MHPRRALHRVTARLVGDAITACSTSFRGRGWSLRVGNGRARAPDLETNLLGGEKTRAYDSASRREALSGVQSHHTAACSIRTSPRFRLGPAVACRRCLNRRHYHSLRDPKQVLVDYFRQRWRRCAHRLASPSLHAGTWKADEAGCRADIFASCRGRSRSRRRRGQVIRARRMRPYRERDRCKSQVNAIVTLAPERAWRSARADEHARSVRSGRPWSSVVTRSRRQAASAQRAARRSIVKRPTKTPDLTASSAQAL